MENERGNSPAQKHRDAAADSRQKQAGNKPDEEPLPVEGLVVVSFGHVLGAGDDPPPGVAEPLVGTSG